MGVQRNTETNEEMDRKFADAYSRLPQENKNIIIGLMTGMVLQEQMEKGSSGTAAGAYQESGETA